MASTMSGRLNARLASKLNHSGHSASFFFRVLINYTEHSQLIEVDRGTQGVVIVGERVCGWLGREVVEWVLHPAMFYLTQRDMHGAYECW